VADADVPVFTVPDGAVVSYTGSVDGHHCPPLHEQDVAIARYGGWAACTRPGAPMEVGRTSYHEGCLACLRAAVVFERAAGELVIAEVGMTLVERLSKSLVRYGEARP
jgi:hypothetical protein